jgi:DNA-binding NarL/FixJ family response regulator
MFKKVLIAEDYESANISVQKTLEDLKIQEPHYVYYCDDALAKIQRGIRDKTPYDLLITDLSFDKDHREQKLNSGKELIEAIRQEQSDIKIIVFSVEKKPDIIDTLFKKQDINAFVSKGREDTKELKRAIKAVYNNEKHISLDIKSYIRERNSYDFTSFEILLITLLSQGMAQKNIPDYLKENKIRPSSLSSVEKRLIHLKDSLNVSSVEQLVALCKDWGII